ncbi:MAG: hypothetical protein IT383_01595 [Deltaproteobacteria bacterium]|nr:hypothetical protein [Deltaproteobacteria bacterium]
MCTIDTRPAEAERQLREGAQVLACELTEGPRRKRVTARARILAELLDALLGDDTPSAVRAAAQELRRRPLAHEAGAARAGGVARLASMLWRMLLEHGALTDARAHILATRLARWLDDARVLLLFEHEAASKQLEGARRVLHHAVASRRPGLLARAQRLPIDRALLARLDLGADVVARYHDNGHLACLHVRGREAPRLELARAPGSGSFRDEGSRGGSRYATSESYRDGHACGMFFSPWHDGDEYRQPIPWLLWVIECAGTIARAARATPRSPRRSRRSR